LIQEGPHHARAKGKRLEFPLETPKKRTREGRVKATGVAKGRSKTSEEKSPGKKTARL